MLAAGVAALRSFGPRYRVGRLLASARRIPMAEAVALARSGQRQYVRVDGRVDSENDFEDADHRPLVLRRTRFESRARRPLATWQTFDVQTEAVPFELNEGLDSIAVDAAALGAGLVVVPRRSAGLVSELGDRGPVGRPDIRPDAAARVTVEQVSSVEHAIAAGVPALDPDGRPILTAGLGRPLVLTTLEIPEAMRILAGGDRGRSRLAAAGLALGGALLVVGLTLWLVMLVAMPAAAAAASPLPSILPGSDTRSPGEGPGLVGDPAFAILGVLGIALATILGTLAYVRASKPARSAEEVPPTRR